MQRWWENDDGAFVHLLDGLAQLNRRTNGDADREYERYFGALDCFATGYWVGQNGAARLAEKALTVRTFVRDAIVRLLDDRNGRNALSDLVQARRVASGSASCGLDDPLHSLVEAVATFSARQDRETAANVGEWLGAPPYVLRRDVDNERAAPSGSPSAIAQPVREVMAAALRVLEELVLRTLEQPQYRLAVYGSLRKGESNFRYIADLGDATAGFVTGTVVERDGYPVFRFDRNGANIPVEVYSSATLTPQKWKTLNEFEGDGYRPLLIAVRATSSGQRIVATIYADAQVDHNRDRPQRA